MTSGAAFDILGNQAISTLHVQTKFTQWNIRNNVCKLNPSNLMIKKNKSWCKYELKITWQTQWVYVSFKGALGSFGGKNKNHNFNSCNINEVDKDPGTLFEGRVR